MSVLDEILAAKRSEVEDLKRRVPPDRLEALIGRAGDSPRRFREALLESPEPRVVAELKRRSPSRGVIRADFDPVACAKMYAVAGAAALSVLTDERYFGGRLEDLGAVREVVPLPLLRKDFVIDAYQIDEAAAFGADAVLLIVAALDPARLAELRARAHERGLDALVEVHDARELKLAGEAGADLIGINNRDLHTFETDLAVTERLAPLAPPGSVIVAESGVFTHGDVQRLTKAGAHAFLVGESLMREPDLGVALRRLRGEA